MSVPPPPATHGRPTERKAAMLFVLITVVLDMVSIGLIVPVLPHLVGTFTTSNEDQTFWFGVVTFTFGVANFVASPILGALSDRYGRRPVLLLGIAGLGLSFFVTAMATALWMVVVVRIFSGAMQANAAVANAYVSDITPPAERARRFGLLGAMFGIGFILGPVMGGLLGALDVHYPFYAAGALAMINWLYGFFVLPESLMPAQRRAFEWRRAQPLTALRDLTALAGVGPLVAAIALAGLAQFILHTSWVLYTHFKFGWGPAEVGWSLFTVGMMMALVQGVLLKHLLKRFSPRRLAAMGLVAGSLTYLGYGLAPAGWVIFLVIIVGTLLSGGAQAAIQSIVANAADPHQQGRTMGAVASLNSLMAVAAPAIGASLLHLVAHRPAGDWLIGLPFFVCAALQASAAVIAIRFFRRGAALAAAPT
jgi:DHA1 family tetracycline resistance protein-like MFS transporter